MLTVDALKEKIETLQKRHARILERKAEIGGELKAKKEELGALVREIQSAGYNPKTLVEDRNNAQQELQALVTDFERDIAEAETSLAAYDKK